MTSEVTYDLGIELLDLDNLCSHVSVVPNCHQSQKFTTFHTLLLPLKPCQEGPLTSRASLGSNNNGKDTKNPMMLWRGQL